MKINDRICIVKLHDAHLQLQCPCDEMAIVPQHQLKKLYFYDYPENVKSLFFTYKNKID